MSEEMTLMLNWVSCVEVAKWFNLWECVLFCLGPTHDSGVPIFLYMVYSVKVGGQFAVVWFELGVKLCLFYLWLSVHLFAEQLPLIRSGTLLSLTVKILFLFFVLFLCHFWLPIVLHLNVRINCYICKETHCGCCPLLRW